MANGKQLAERILAKAREKRAGNDKKPVPKAKTEYEQLLEHDLYRRIKELALKHSAYEMAQILKQPVERITKLRHNLHSAALKLPPSRETKQEEKHTPPEFSAEDLAVFAWFAFNRGSLPTEPFQLDQGRHVSNPKKFYDALERSVAEGPAGPRSLYGALLSDIKRLKELYGTANEA